MAIECKSKPKYFWKYVQDKLKISTGIGTLKNENGETISTDKGKANVLNNFFSSVFTKEDRSNLPEVDRDSKSKGNRLTDIDIDVETVKKKLRELDVSKAQGPDQLPARVLKEIANEISEPLTKLFKLTLEQGELPKEWKNAEVIAIFKKGTKTDPGNYRPVSLTCITCKVMESIIRDNIDFYFKENKLISDCQHGFRRKRSCVTQLLCVMEQFTKLMDTGKTIDVVYLDFKKAFDSVPHERLLLKLSAYGLDGKVLQWIRSFLSDRTQRVRVGTSYSEQAEVTSGIPQGSILGPVLFTIFINDLPDVVNSQCKIFADDTKVYNTSDKKDLLQADLHSLQTWTEKWNLYFNVQKCKVMYIGKKNPKHDYFMKLNNITSKISECDSEKDLGITLDTSLKFDNHIQKKINKANQVMGLIKRSFDYLHKDVFVRLYKTLVRPHLEYGNSVWHPNLKRQSIAIEKVQRRATKVVKACKNMSYEERLRFLHLPSLKGRRIRGDLIQVYKIVTNIDDVDFHDFFTNKTVDKTRNSDGKLFLNRSITNIRKQFFTNRAVPLWNDLPPKIKSAPNINQFKNLLDDNPKMKAKLQRFDE